MKKRIMTPRMFSKLKEVIRTADKSKGWKSIICKRFHINRPALEKILANPTTNLRPYQANLASLKRYVRISARHYKNCAHCGKTIPLNGNDYCSDNCALLSIEYAHHLAINEAIKTESWRMFHSAESMAARRLNDNGRRPAPQMAVI